MDLITFVKSRLAILEQVQGIYSLQSVLLICSDAKSNSDFKVPRRLHRLPTTSLKTDVSSMVICFCNYCDGLHTLHFCRNANFRALSVDDCINWLRIRRLWFFFWANRCKSTISCTSYSRRHHSLLHTETEESINKCDFNAPIPSLCTSTSLLSGRNSPSILLGTVLVHEWDRFGFVHTVRVLIDSASKITGSCSSRLGFWYMSWIASLTGLSGLPYCML